MNAPATDIMHVEDDDEWAELVKIWLDEAGLRTERHRSFADMRARLTAMTCPPRCLLLDLALADGDGLDVCNRLKRDPLFQSIPIVIFTGRDIAPARCLSRRAVGRVLKGPDAKEELTALLAATLDQRDRSRGMVDFGDVRLDAPALSVSLRGGRAVVLKPGAFAALQRLVGSSPESVPDEVLHASFMERRPYDKRDPELAVRLTVRTYVSSLRKALGAALGARIKRLPGGYAYVPPSSPPRLGVSSDQFQID